jgi:hypothetical protein
MASERPRLTGAWKYVLISDRSVPADQQSTFTLLPLTAGERDFYRDHYNSHVASGNGGGPEQVNNVSQTARSICLTHIEAVDNFPAGKPRAWPAGKDERAEFLDRLHDAHVVELGVEVFTRSFLGTEEKQQLGEVSPPTPTSG